MYALLVAIGACFCGGVLASGDSAPTPEAHRTATKASPSPIALLPPDGPRLTGTIDQVDARYDRLVIDVEGRRLAYGLNALTHYPAPCLQAATLRRGQRVTLTLPWYMGGQAYILAVAPSHGCSS